MMNRMTGGRPLMTDHLQDLEMELQMLKRKRQLIQQQQQQQQHDIMMSQRQNNYGRIQPFDQQYDDQSFTQDFSQFYTDFNEPSNYRENRQFNKRAANVWQDQLPPKRFAGAQNSVNRQNNFHNQRPTNRNFQPSGGVGNRKNNGRRAEPMRPPRTHRPEPSKAQQNFAQGSKPRPANRARPFVDNSPQSNRPQANLRTNFKAKAAAKPPNKLNSYPQAQRKSLVAKAAKEIEAEQSTILLKDKAITKLMSGRLELALGQIMKQVKEKFEADEKYSPNFKVQHHQKTMKQGVRDRLRLALEGKPVDVVADVVAAYRLMFPDETDRDIVELPLESEREKAKVSKTFVDSADPDEFYSINMKKILCSKLDEMFAKLKTLYQEENALKPGVILNNTADGTNGSLNSTDNQDLNDTKVDENVDTSVAQNGDEAKQADEENNEAKVEDKNETGNNINDEKKEESVIEKKAVTIDVTEIEAKINELLPDILPKYKNCITKLLAHDRGFRYARSAVAFEASKRASQLDNYGKRTGDAATSDDTNEKPKQTLPYSQLFYVKIFGRPNLPKRPLMQAFLDKFQPKSIKKHKGVKNLLFVGFADQASQEKILAENKIIIGKCSITIKISETAKKDNAENADTSDANVSLNETKDASMTEEESKVEEPTEGQVTPDIGTQIDDLLSTIKKADEEEREKTEIDNSVASTDEIVKDNTADKNESAEDQNGGVEAEEAKDKVEIGEAKGTPTRASTRIANATPGAVRTRRASKLAQN